MAKVYISDSASEIVEVEKQTNNETTKIKLEENFSQYRKSLRSNHEKAELDDVIILSEKKSKYRQILNGCN